MYFGEKDQKSLNLDNEKNLIEKSIKEAKQSRNVQFFCKGEKQTLLSYKMNRWKFVPSKIFDLTAE